MNNSILPLSLVVFVLVVCLFLTGCYTVKQGVTYLGYLSKAIPLEKSDDEDFIRLVAEIRTFAMEELGLTNSKNYTSFVRIDRNYLASVVSASAKDSFRRYEWNYPVVGRMPYKGFFNIKDAQKERAKLEKKDLDVWIRGVDAFSSLGWFKDPLFSYMREYSPSRLADLIIHELVHSTVFIKGQVKFNEELAQFIGSEGALLFMEKRYGLDSDEYNEMLKSEQNSNNYVAFIQELIAELETLYSGDSDREEKLIRKEQIINDAKLRFNNEYENLFSNENYRGFNQLPINNAYLELFRLYHTDDNFYNDLYDRTGRNLPVFIAAAKTITKKSSKGTPREQLESSLALLTSGVQINNTALDK
ncbi:MAG: aminopeptidase [Treponema sp.]|nr:aminopeptidase [Treponema sp.]MCL2250722.1 aminopeptidase [Treponema sp.]